MDLKPDVIKDRARSVGATTHHAVCTPRAVRRRQLAASLVLATALHAAPAACANATFNVDTVADLVDANSTDGLCRTAGGSCSLRAAVSQANNLSGSGSALIVIPTGTYVLSLANGLYLGNSSHPDRSMIVNGAGAASTIIDCNQGGNVTVDSTLVALVSGITLRNGRASRGGGFDNNGGLILIRSTVENSHANNDGGGIANNGDLNVIQSLLRGNTAMYGGGIYNEGRARVSESTLHVNRADYDGGGILNSGRYDNANHLYVINSTLSFSVANADGGGIKSKFDGSITALYNTTLVDNGADDDHDENGGVGGGLHADSGARVILVNTLFASNTRTVFSDDDCYGVVEAYGRNFFGDAADCSTNNGGLLYHVTPASVALLHDNGGPTWTHALLAGSEAIDSAQVSLGCVDETGVKLATDQRGAPRPSVNRYCDAGSFEFGAVVAVTDLIFRNGFDGGM